MSRRLDEVAATDGEVKMYVCGITPYDHAHLGHAMSYIVFDVLRRYLEFRGHRIRHVQNYTDIDDRIIARASAQGLSFDQLAQSFIDEYEQEMREMNIAPAHVYPRVSQEIPQIVDLVSSLINKGYAYAADGDVYYQVQKKADYGKLSGRDIDSMIAGARVEPSKGKTHPADFALWKASKPGEPAWDSPWGSGRPGWHIECSSMSLRYLGDTMDIHGGGQDLIFPHHENEIAQSEAYTGVQPSARHWVHNGWLFLDQEKMSKSLGNIITIRECLDQYGADGIRVFVLTSHYRAPITYSEDGLAAGKRAAERLRRAVALPGGHAEPSPDPKPSRQRFMEAMDDDLNTAGALAVLFDLARDINRARDEGRCAEDAQATLRELADVLGLTLREPEGTATAGPFIDLLVELRTDLRDRKLYDVADSLRERLAGLGITLEDVSEGTRWRQHR